MKTMYFLCTFLLSFGISASLFSKSSHHFVTVKNDTNYDIILAEFEQTTEIHKHTISARSEKKCDFFKNTEYVEARVKLGSNTFYTVGSPITFSHKTITITQQQTLHIRAQ